MVAIQVQRGLDIPIGGRPTGELTPLVPGGSASPQYPKQISLNLNPFDDLRFRLLVPVGERVKKGAPLALDKSTEKRVFVSPAGGTVSEIRRGLKRRLLDIVIDVEPEEEVASFPPLDPTSCSRQALTERLLEGGIFAHLHARPFDRLATPHQVPRSIFVKAIETAPFLPPAEMHVKGFEEEFQIGLFALKKLTDGPVHLVYKKGSSFAPFTQAKGVELHTAEGPHPAGTHSVHIHHLDPIRSADDVVWTANAYDVVLIGHLLRLGTYLTDRNVAIAGPSVLDGRCGYFQTRTGIPVASLTAGRIGEGDHRLISGDPLMGAQVEPTDFLNFHHFTLTAIPEPIKREFLHFFRLGFGKFSASRAYLSLKNTFRFTTSLHGEPRPFIEPSLYNKVMPLPIPTMQLVKAVMAKDYDLAEELGLLEVVEEDFALPTFVCPSKIEITEIMKQGLRQHALEVIG